ncbi:ketopantoate reductase family protein [uncultured Dubosiella sp.]|uniref:ketopantoate reductase family protein n=1 Tax=uncultured Dubosiella sp. TaxID=1937011 RepID=UPI002622FB74|nr:ketopantoate reductase family protein [uncultured Dubosiella sp.]
MEEIKKVLVAGRGAVGGLFGSLIEQKIGSDFAFLCDEKRKQKYDTIPYTINGVEKKYNYAVPASPCPVDLILITTKAGAFHEAAEMIRPFLKEDTILISGLNGIESDELLMKTFDQPVIRAISQKMDARYQNNTLTYTQTGELVIGMERKEQRESFERLIRFFDRIGFPYVNSKDIVHDQYSKLMLNCGINQVCAAYRITYGKTVNDPQYRKLFIDVMKETRDILSKYGVYITDHEIAAWVKAIEALDPDSMPSMAQDILAERKTERDLFSGTIIRMAEEKGVSAPLNEQLYEQIEAIEKEFA